MALPSPSRRFRIVFVPDPPEQRLARAFPLSFTVEGRGTAVYLPYLLPLGCGEVRVLVHGGRRVAAVVDGAYHRIEQEYQVADPDGFVLLGDELSPDSTIQFPKTLPAWLADAISKSYQNAQEGLTALLDAPRKDVPLFVDFSTEGTTEAPRNGGDAVRGHCAMRLWFHGCNDVLVQWAHEGHAPGTMLGDKVMTQALRNAGIAASATGSGRASRTGRARICQPVATAVTVWKAYFLWRPS